MAIQQNLTMYKGESLVIKLALKNADGSPKNLTGATLYYTAKWGYTDPDAQAISQLTTSNGIVITNALAGLATVTMPEFATSVLTGDGEIDIVYDVKSIIANIGTIEQAGGIAILPAVTRAIV